MKRISALLALAVSLGTYQPAGSSAATPVPGGANQAAGVAGTFGQKLFNGELRLVPKQIRDAIDSDGLTRRARAEMDRLHGVRE